jgi:hypothetical protein
MACVHYTLQVSYEEFHALVLSPDPVLDWSLRAAGADKGTTTSNKVRIERTTHTCTSIPIDYDALCAAVLVPASSTAQFCHF